MIILITGSSSGIGLQLARDYLVRSNTVYCCGRNVAKLKTLKREFPDFAQIVCFDMQNRDDCKTGLSMLPALDLVILNAGTCEYITATSFDSEMFERVVKTNLIGTANCLEFLIPKIKPDGKLALMGSSSSYLPLPRAEAYGASKAAIEYLAKTLAISLKSIAVRVSYIAPGFVQTPLTELNDFPMPMSVSVEYASEKIRAGLSKNKAEINFPLTFTWILKTIRVLPIGLQQLLVARLYRSSSVRRNLDKAS
jgi:short-subunit dehydrogenase|tara:strand:+ start:1767 stop:2522 length:756 start_codon:yes stop_codon:yes gene_type:complete